MGSIVDTEPNATRERARRVGDHIGHVASSERERDVSRTRSARWTARSARCSMAPGSTAASIAESGGSVAIGAVRFPVHVFCGIGARAAVTPRRRRRLRRRLRRAAPASLRGSRRAMRSPPPSPEGPRRGRPASCGAPPRSASPSRVRSAVPPHVAQVQRHRIVGAVEIITGGVGCGGSAGRRRSGVLTGPRRHRAAAMPCPDSTVVAYSMRSAPASSSTAVSPEESSSAGSESGSTMVVKLPRPAARRASACSCGTLQSHREHRRQACAWRRPAGFRPRPARRYGWR